MSAIALVAAGFVVACGAFGCAGTGTAEVWTDGLLVQRSSVRLS